MKEDLNLMVRELQDIKKNVDEILEILKHEGILYQDDKGRYKAVDFKIKQKKGDTL